MKKKSIKKKYVFYAVLVLLILLIKGGIYSDISVEELKKEYANEHSKFVEIDEKEVHYRDEGTGFPIVFIHGTASSLHTWNDWTTELKKKYRIIRMDLPAFGITGPNKNADYSIKSYTQFLHKFLSKINIDKFYLAGNSLGGNIAWNYTAEYPDKIKKLILVDASGLPTNKPQPAIFKMAKTPVLNSLFLYVTPKFIIKKSTEATTDNLVWANTSNQQFHERAANFPFRGSNIWSVGTLNQAINGAQTNAKAFSVKKKFCRFFSDL